MRTYRAFTAAALTSIALIAVTGCSNNSSAADAAQPETSRASGTATSGDQAEQTYSEALSMAFPADHDAAELVELGHQACTGIRARGGVQPDDYEAMAAVAMDLAQATGNRYGEMQYGFIVGLSSKTFCADALQGSDTSS